MTPSQGAGSHLHNPCKAAWLLARKQQLLERLQEDPARRTCQHRPLAQGSANRPLLAFHHFHRVKRVILKRKGEPVRTAVKQRGNLFNPSAIV